MNIRSSYLGGYISSFARGVSQCNKQNNIACACRTGGARTVRCIVNMLEARCGVACVQFTKPRPTT